MFPLALKKVQMVKNGISHSSSDTHLQIKNPLAKSTPPPPRVEFHSLHPSAIWKTLLHTSKVSLYIFSSVQNGHLANQQNPSMKA